MSKISRRWIRNSAVDSTKIDSGDSYILESLSVNKDTTVGQNLQISGNVGIGTESHDESLHLYSSSSEKPIVKIENTTNDINGPSIQFKKWRSTPASGDILGTINGYGKNSSSNLKEYGYIRLRSSDIGENQESGRFQVDLLVNKTSKSLLDINGYNGTPGQAEIIFNQDGVDCNVRVESAINENSFFIQGSNGYIGIGTGTPQNSLHIDGTAVLTNGRLGIGITEPQNSLHVDGTAVITNGSLGIGTNSPAARLSINGGCHVGGTTDPGDNNLTVDGNIIVDGGNIGITADTDLVNLTLNTLTVDGTVAATEVTGANVTSGADPGHTHTGSSLSNIDISENTNLAVTSPIVLTGDTLSHSNENGYVHIPSDGTSTQVLQYSSAGTAKWVTLSGDATIADGGAITIDHSNLEGLSSDDHTQYALLDGRDGGQTLYGGTSASNNLTLSSTSNATKGFIIIPDGKVGIGETSPDEMLHITSNTSTKPIIKLENTTNDVDSAGLDFYKTRTATNGDQLGIIRFYGKDSGGVDTRYGFIAGKSLYVTDGDESGRIDIQIVVNNSTKEFITMRGYNGSVGQADIIFNNEGIDCDFQVKSDTLDHAFFIQGSNGYVGINESSPDEMLHLTSSTSGKPIIKLETTDPGANGTSVAFYKVSAGPADGDYLGNLISYGLNNNVTPETFNYATISFRSTDISDGDEAGSITLWASVDGNVRNMLTVNGFEGPLVGNASVIINEDSVDCDFRVESDNLTHAFFIQGSDGYVGINEDSPNSIFQITGSFSGFDLSKGIILENANSTIGDCQGIGFRTRGGDNNIKSSFGVIRTDSDGYGRNAFVFWNDNAANNDNVALADEVMRITSDGKVGIAQTTPLAALHIGDGSTNYRAALELNADEPTIKFKSGNGATYKAWSFRHNDNNENNFKFRLETSAGSDTYSDILIFDGAGRVGINESEPDELLHLTSDVAYKPIIKIENTTADANGASIYLLKNRTATDGDELGTIKFYGNNDAVSPEVILYGYIRGKIRDKTDGSEDGEIITSIKSGGNDHDLLTMSGGSQPIITFNDASIDCDFQVKSDNLDYALFVQGSDGKVGINESSPDEMLHLTSDVAYKPVIKLENTTNDANGAYIYLLKNRNPTNNDELGRISSRGNNTNYPISEKEYAYISFISKDTSVDAEEGTIKFWVEGTGSILELKGGDNSVADIGDVIINEGGTNCNFRIESTASDHAFFVQGDGEKVSIGTSSLSDAFLTIAGDVTLTSGADRTITVDINTEGDTGYDLTIEAGTGTESECGDQYGGDLYLNAGTGSAKGDILLAGYDISLTGDRNIIINGTVYVNDEMICDAMPTLKKGINVYGGTSTLTNGNADVKVSSAIVNINDNYGDIDFAVGSVPTNAAFFVQGSDGYIGMGSITPASKLHIVGGSSYDTIRFANNTTNSTNKLWGISSLHYTNSEPTVATIQGINTSSANGIYIGGGDSSYNAATLIAFYTAANYTTVTGTERMRIASDGKVGIGTNNPSDALTVGGFSKLGSLSVPSGFSSVAIKVVEYTGTTDADTATDVAFTDANTKVKSVAAWIEAAAGVWYGTGNDEAVLNYYVTLTSTSIRLNHSSGTLQSKSFRLLVSYSE